MPPLNTAEPATKALAPAAANWPETSGPTPPSTSISIGRPAVMALMIADLAERGGNEGLAAEAGIDRHHQHQIDHVDDIFDGADRRARVERRRRPSCRALRIACSERCRCGPASACTVM